MCSTGMQSVPPLANNTNPRTSEFVLSFSDKNNRATDGRRLFLFFAIDYFGIYLETQIASPEPQTPTSWQTQKRDGHGLFAK